MVASDLPLTRVAGVASSTVEPLLPIISSASIPGDTGHRPRFRFFLFFPAERRSCLRIAAAARRGDP